MAAFPDWGSILPASGAPLALAEDPDFLWSQPSRVRAAFVRLREVARAAAKREAPAAPVAVHVDVLRIEGAVVFACTGLTLHARRIEVAAGASLTVAPPREADPACVLRLHAAEWGMAEGQHQLPLKVGGMLYPHVPGPAGAGLVAELAADGSLTLHEDVDPPAGDALTGQIALDTARRLVHSPQLDPAWTTELPLKMIDWVARTGADPLLRSDALAFAAHLRTPRGQLRFVPYLRLSEYADLAQVTQTALAAVEQAHANLFNRALNLDDQKQAAAHLLSHYEAAKGYADKMLQQAADETARASEATEHARAMLQQRSNEIAERQKAFERGIEDKKAQLEREAAFGIAMGVLSLGIGIAMVCFTGPAGAGVAAGGAAKVAEAGAKTAKQVNRLVELLEVIAKVLDAIQKIQGYYKLLKSTFDAIRDPLEARARAEAAGRQLPQPLAPEDSMGAADWDEFMVGLDAAFRPALDQGIDGADDFLLTMKKLAIRGKDLVATQANLDRSQQRLQRCLWQTLRDESDIADMKARVAALDVQRGPGMVLMTYHAQLRDRLKFRLMHAIQNMSDAYRYDALAEPSFQPSIASSGAELAKMLSDVQQALVTSRERRGSISDWGPDGLTEQAPGALASLRQIGTMGWSVGPENFVGLERIRVRDIRVWLQGDWPDEPRGQRFHIVITTSGDYLDRLDGRPFEFATWPLWRNFRYELDPHGRERDAWGQPVSVTLKANDAEGDFFEPTAFSSWSISLPADFNPGLDTSRITGVALEFIGTAMGAKVRTRGAATRARGLRAAPTHLLRKVITL